MFRSHIARAAAGRGESTAWTLSAVTYVQSFDVRSQSTYPRSVVFKPDGTRMYITDSLVSDVFEYSLSTAWDVSTASYVRGFSIGQDTRQDGLFFKPDGTKMYTAGFGANYVYEYNLSTAWDVSTITYVHSLYVVNEARLPSGISIKPDGTKMYVAGGNAIDGVAEYNLSTAWDISSATFVHRFDVTSFVLRIEDVFLKPDGTKMYVTDAYSDRVHEYNLSTAWDVSTASHVQSIYVRDWDTTASGIFIKPDGTKLYLTGIGSDEVHEYDLL